MARSAPPPRRPIRWPTRVPLALPRVRVCALLLCPLLVGAGCGGTSPRPKLDGSAAGGSEGQAGSSGSAGSGDQTGGTGGSQVGAGGQGQGGIGRGRRRPGGAGGRAAATPGGGGWQRAGAWERGRLGGDWRLGHGGKHRRHWHRRQAGHARGGRAGADRPPDTTPPPTPRRRTTAPAADTRPSGRRAAGSPAAVVATGRELPTDGRLHPADVRVRW
jgi:hypothetical protein